MRASKPFFLIVMQTGRVVAVKRAPRHVIDGEFVLSAQIEVPNGEPDDGDYIIHAWAFTPDPAVVR